MGIFLHAVFQDDRLLLWGETARANAAPLPRPRGRRPKEAAREQRAPSNPFDIGAEALDDSVGWLAAQDEIERATLWLPTVAEQPVASSPVVEESPNGAAN